MFFVAPNQPKTFKLRGPRKLWKAIELFVTTPSILMLLLASSIRHTGTVFFFM